MHGTNVKKRVKEYFLGVKGGLDLMEPSGPVQDLYSDWFACTSVPFLSNKMTM
jgi:hypothetical protein